MDLFKAVKETVTARQAAELYGLKIAENGMARCPFHDDHTPSLKLDKRYYCFGCHATGDAIDFVSTYLQLSPLEAAKRLAADFNIPYNSDHSGKQDHSVPLTERRRVQKAQMERQEFLDWRRKTLFDLAGYYRVLEEKKELFAPQTRDEPWSESFVQSCRDQNLVELYAFLLENAPEEDQQTLFAGRATTIESLAQRIDGGRPHIPNERQWQFIQKSPSKTHPKSQRRNAPQKRCTERE